MNLSKLSVQRLKALRKRIYAGIGYWEGCSCEFGCCRRFENFAEMPEYIELKEMQEKVNKELAKKQRKERLTKEPKYNTFKIRGDKRWYVSKNK